MKDLFIKIPDWIYTNGKEITLRYQNPDGEYIESTFYPIDQQDLLTQLITECEGMKVTVEKYRCGDGCCSSNTFSNPNIVLEDEMDIYNQAIDEVITLLKNKRDEI